MTESLTIILPARFEEETIVKVLEEIDKRVKTPHAIIVVNDFNPLDKTAKLVKDYAKKKKHVHLYIQKDEKKKSFANALINGINFARKGFVIPVMADLCDELELIDVLYKKMKKEKWDIICASRYMKGGKKEGGPFIQSFLSRLVCLSLNVITGVPTNDISNSFKMYRKSTLSEVIIDPKGGVETSMAITLQCYFNKAMITEIPTVWKHRILGSSKFKISKRAPRYFKIYIWAIKNSIRSWLGLTPLQFVVTN